MLLSASVVAATDIRDEVLRFLCQEDDDLLPCLMTVLRTARALSPAQRDDTGLDALARHCARRIQARLAVPPRREDDWSIEPRGGCGCQVCDVLGGFLMDPDRWTFEWPLAKEGRRHVHGIIDGTELAVRHQTRRTGRPYTLVLTKAAELLEGERRARHRDQVDLAWLSGQEHPLAGPLPRR